MKKLKLAHKLYEARRRIKGLKRTLGIVVEGRDKIARDCKTLRTDLTIAHVKLADLQYEDGRYGKDHLHDLEVLNESRCRDIRNAGIKQLAAARNYMERVRNIGKAMALETVTEEKTRDTGILLMNMAMEGVPPVPTHDIPRTPPKGIES